MKSVLVRKFRRLLVVPAASIVFAGCHSATGPTSLPGGVEIRPTAGSFPVQVVDGRKTVTVSAVVRNESDRTVYYSYCSEGIAKLEGGVWGPIRSTECPSIALPPEPIEPGKAKQFTLRIDDYPDIPSREWPF